MTLNYVFVRQHICPCSFGVVLVSADHNTEVDDFRRHQAAVCGDEELLLTTSSPDL